MIHDYFPHVEGWLLPEALLFTRFYRQSILQKVDFDSLEIGVHHGKFFVGIERLTPKNRYAYAVDVFNEQGLNVDKSGKGDLARFHENINAYCIDSSRVKIIEADSFNCRHLLPDSQDFAIVSIDGGHTAKHTINDMVLAQDLLHPKGVIILDDILNPAWLGVAEGAIKFMSSTRCTRILPFAIGFNKLFLTHFSNHGRAMQVVKSESDQLACTGLAVDKLTSLCGTDVAVIKRSHIS